MRKPLSDTVDNTELDRPHNLTLYHVAAEELMKADCMCAEPHLTLQAREELLLEMDFL